MNERILELLIRAQNATGPAIAAASAAVRKFGVDAGKSMNALNATAKNTAKTIKENFLGAFMVIGMAMYGLKKTWDVVWAAAERQQAQSAFHSLAHSYKVDAQEIIKALKAAAAEMIDTEEAMRLASQAMLRGINPTQLVKMMEVARASARVMGIDVSQAFDMISVSVARQSSRMLYSMGLAIDADAAQKNYATSLGKTAAALTEAEKRQAFLNAVLAAGEVQIAKVGTTQLTTLETLKSWKVIWKEVGDVIGDTTLKLLQFLVMLQLFNPAKIGTNIAEMLANLKKGVAPLETIKAKLKEVADMWALVTGKADEAAQKQQDAAAAAAKALPTKTLAQGWQDVKAAVDAASQGTMNYTSAADFAQDRLKGLIQLQKDAKVDLVQLWQDLGTSMRDNLATAIEELIWHTKSAKEVFLDFGKAVLTTIIQMFAKLVASMIMSKLVSLLVEKTLTSSILASQSALSPVLAANAAFMSIITLGAADAIGVAGMATAFAASQTMAAAASATSGALSAGTFHSGGRVGGRGLRVAHTGMLAQDEQLILAQDGERVLSRGQNQAYENQGGVTNSRQAVTHNYYIQAVDARSFAQLVKSNPGAISAVVQEGVTKNTSLRKTIKRYA